MEKQTIKTKRGFKKIVRLSKGRRASKVTPKNLENDFEREVEDERTLEIDEVPLSQLERPSKQQGGQGAPAQSGVTPSHNDERKRSHHPRS